MDINRGTGFGDGFNGLARTAQDQFAHFSLTIAVLSYCAPKKDKRGGLRARRKIKNLLKILRVISFKLFFFSLHKIVISLNVGISIRILSFVKFIY